MRRASRAILAVVASLALAALIVGCGGTSSGDATKPSSKISTARALITKYQREPKFIAPGPAFNARKVMAGKKIMIIPISSQIPITKVLTTSMAQQAKQIGFTFTAWQNQGASSQWIQGIQQAIAQHYAVVDLLAIPPDSLRPQIQQARRAGVKVISSHFAGFGWQVPSFIDGAVRLPYYQVGRILAAWATLQTKGKADVLSIVANDLVSTNDVVKGMKDEFAAVCPGCKLDLVNVPTVDWSQDVQGEVQSAIQRNPGINYVLPIYDAMTPFVSAGLRTSSRSDLGQASFNGTPSVLTAVKDGSVAMDIGENEDWIAHAMLDADMRAAAGLGVPKDDYKGAPLFVFTKQNVARAGTPPNPAQGYGNAYRSGFARLWKLG